MTSPSQSEAVPTIAQVFITYEGTEARKSASPAGDSGASKPAPFPTVAGARVSLPGPCVPRC